MNHAFGYVYLIGSRAFKWYKIGKAKHAQVRLETIGILLPFKIEVFAVWASWSKDAERRMHRKYADHRINGEWFHFEDKELKSVIVDSQDNLTLMDGGIAFTNMERDCGCPEGKVIRVKTLDIQKNTPQKILEYILIHKLRQAAREF